MPKVTVEFIVLHYLLLRNVTYIRHNLNGLEIIMLFGYGDEKCIQN